MRRIMRVCVLHAAKDLRLEERPIDRLGPGQVRIGFGAGGICGSDLHYYFHGRVGDFAVREPLILGHEMAGDVVETGPGVTRVRVGDRVAINPSLPCWQCRACQAGRTNLCRRMTFFGSAAVMPHVRALSASCSTPTRASASSFPARCRTASPPWPSRSPSACTP
jgi:L-idonate 5-dehydrogenase